MSGGSHNYICYTIEETLCRQMHDKEMDDLIEDVAKVAHDLEWYESGDTNETTYRDSVKAFKKKWFNEVREDRLKRYVMLHQLNFDGKDKVDIAIERIKTMQPDEGYYLCFSGGKDSVVIKALADMAGVKYDAHYNITGIDPPDLVYFIREYHKDVIFDYPYDKDGNRITMWNLIPRKLMPPTRLVRYCCQELKESGMRYSIKPTKKQKN